MTELRITDLSVTELADRIQRREISATLLTETCLDQVGALQDRLNAFVAIRPNHVLQQAKACDEALANGLSTGPLHGIPVAVKDNYWTSDFPTTGCSKVHQGKSIGSDATAVAKLRQAGAIIIGKTNMHEWAYGATNEISANGPTRNPWNTNHITGGSSGGSGAALASRMVPAALGSDTGGSVRIPSAGCGVCGIKPTYGHVSRHGILPLSWSLDVAGPMARSARDLALLLSVIGGNDSKDPATETFAGIRSVGADGIDPSRLRLAIPSGQGFEAAADVKRTFQQALESFIGLGALVQDIEVPHMKEGFGAWNVILHSEASTYHAEFLKTSSSDYSDSVRIHLDVGRCLSATDYLKAQQYRAVFNRQVNALVSGFDALVLPTLPVTAPRIGQSQVSFGGKKISSQDSMTYVAWLANFTGHPAVSIPCGFGDNGLPVGMMLIGAAGSDFRLLEIADAFQQTTDWHLMAPKAQ